MISDNFWKIIFVLMVLGGLGYWYKNFDEEKKFKNTASELADLIDFSPDARPRDDAEAHERYIRAIALIQGAEVAGVPSGALVDAALAYNEVAVDADASSLIRTSLFEGKANAEKLGAFHPDSIWDLREGQTVKITKGPYTGEKIAVSLRLPAAICEESRLFSGNFIITPESVATIAKEAEITESVYNTSIKLANGKIIAQETAKAIKEAFYTQRERNRY